MNWQTFKQDRRSLWLGYSLLAIALAVLPFAVGAGLGNAWLRTLNFALLYIMLALGLNIVVGFAGLLDMGYIAFYAVGAYLYALLASPHLGNAFPALFPGGLHWPVWAIIPLGAGVAGLFGLLLGAPHPAPAGGLSGHRHPGLRGNYPDFHEQPERPHQYHQRAPGHFQH